MLFVFCLKNKTYWIINKQGNWDKGKCTHICRCIFTPATVSSMKEREKKNNYIQIITNFLTAFTVSVVAMPVKSWQRSPPLQKKNSDKTFWEMRCLVLPYKSLEYYKLSVTQIKKINEKILLSGTWKLQVSTIDYSHV